MRNEDEPKHEKVTDYIQDEDGLIIDEKSYYDKLSSHVRSRQKLILTNYSRLKVDVEQALSHFTEDGSPRLVITIENKPTKGIVITKRWVELKKNYPKR